MDSWISVKNLKGETIKVRQNRKYGDIFVDEKGNEYKVSHLDFSEVVPTMGEKELADYRALIADKEFWCNTRIEIFLEMYRNYLATGKWMKSEDDLLNKTKYLVNQLWQQDHDFFFEKKVFNIPVK